MFTAYSLINAFSPTTLLDLSVSARVGMLTAARLAAAFRRRPSFPSPICRPKNRAVRAQTAFYRRPPNRRVVSTQIVKPIFLLQIDAP